MFIKRIQVKASCIIFIQKTCFVQWTNTFFCKMMRDSLQITAKTWNKIELNQSLADIFRCLYPVLPSDVSYYLLSLFQDEKCSESVCKSWIFQHKVSADDSLFFYTSRLYLAQIHHYQIFLLIEFWNFFQALDLCKECTIAF